MSANTVASAADLPARHGCAARGSPPDLSGPVEDVQHQHVSAGWRTQPAGKLLFLDELRRRRSVEKVPMTIQGLKSLEKELKFRQQEERPRIILAIQEARAHGDLSENAEYSAAKEAQSLNEGRITELESLIARAEVIDLTKLSGNTIKFGATVTLIDEDTEKERSYTIVGDVEADVKLGKIALSSPIARALIGKKVGDAIEVNTPGGGKSYEITGLRFG
jgi:transcription elongation factor GreA